KTMGTTWHLILAKGDVSGASKMVQTRLDELESIFTNWREDSAVSRFNASRSTEWQSVPRELVDVVTLAQRISKETQGAFDITASPLIDLWGFGAKGRTKTIPSDEAIAAAKARCGWEKIEVQTKPPRLRKAQADVEINVSGLVEGYAVDDIVKRLRDAGHANFLLDVGGELYASSTKPDGSPWEVGVQQPDAEKGVVTGAVPLQDKALSTSGTYQQFFEVDGKRFPHVLDARTGRPVSHSLVSVSVIADTCFEADSWTTALLILGPTEGREVAKRLGIDALFLAESPP
ncbi:MAG: FAD:protein FMN transferase, partial [Roseimicrobium sp.]